MAQRRAYPRTPLERQGQVNYRATDFDRYGHPLLAGTPRCPLRSANDRDPTPRHVREGVEPNCVVTTTKRKGFGSLGEKESEPGSIHASNLLLKQLSPELFYRYRVNVYLK